ncbi:Omp28-related outer membrane protein, partial [bacterium]|nr:Omp28-related outer membrane protein [bacterium]
MRLIKLLSIALLVFAFSVSAATRIPLIERFTNIGCGYCPPCGQMVDSLTGVHGSALSAVEVHVDWTIPTDPYYVADAADCEERWTHYGITGVPAVAVDGKKLAYWSTAPAEISTRMGVTSPIDMSISTTDSSIIVSVDVESALVGSGYRLLTAVVEDSNYLPSSPNGEVWANNVQRKLYPSSTGEAIDLSAVGTQVFEYPFTWDSEWNPLMCGVVAWVQDLSAAVTSCNIVNSALGILPPPAYFFTYVPDEVQAAVWSDTAIVLDAGVLTNHGTNSDTYSLKIEKDLPLGWSSSYCAGASCFPDSGSITLPPDSGVGIDVDFFTAGDGVGT